MRLAKSCCAILVGVCAAAAFGPAARNAVQAAPALVIETTFDCAEWDQLSGTDPCPLEPAVTPGGNWTGPSGRGDRITLAANNPLGAGRGLRHWRESGTNSGGGGLKIDIPPTKQLWLRMYMRYSAGFAWTNSEPHYTKDIYWNNGQSNFMILGFNSGQLYTHVGPGSQNLMSSDTWAAINGGAVGDGKFHCYEQYIKVDTNGSNGEMKIWRDGNLVFSRTGLNLGGGPIGQFTLGSNQADVVGSNHYTDYDDIAISYTGYIGPLTGQSTSAPAAPANLRIVP